MLKQVVFTSAFLLAVALGNNEPLPGNALVAKAPKEQEQQMDQAALQKLMAENEALDKVMAARVAHFQQESRAVTAIKAHMRPPCSAPAATFSSPAKMPLGDNFVAQETDQALRAAIAQGVSQRPLPSPKCARGKSWHGKQGREHLEVGGGWKQFLFGPVGSTVAKTFHVYNRQFAYLKLTDYFCSGDEFDIYIDGYFAGHSSEARFDNCRTKTLDPDHAYFNRAWSHFEYGLLPGPHEITIVVTRSPYGEGYAALRVDPVLTKCCKCIGEFTVIDTPLPWASADFACRTFGLRLADVDVFNFNEATKEVFACAGPNSAAYVKSYWGNTYNDSCLALHVGSAAPGGSLNVEAKCSHRLPILCQGHSHSCGGRFLRSV